MILPGHPVQLLAVWDGLQPSQGSRGTVLPVLSEPWVLHSHPPWGGTLAKQLTQGSAQVSDNPNSHILLSEQLQKTP